MCLVLTDFAMLLMYMILPSEQRLLVIFDPHFRLWTMSSDFITKSELWLNGPFMNLDANAMRDSIVSWCQEGGKMQRQLLRSSPAASKVAGAFLYFFRSTI